MSTHPSPLATSQQSTNHRKASGRPWHWRRLALRTPASPWTAGAVAGLGPSGCSGTWGAVEPLGRADGTRWNAIVGLAPHIASSRRLGVSLTRQPPPTYLPRTVGNHRRSTSPRSFTLPSNLRDSGPFRSLSPGGAPMILLDQTGSSGRLVALRSPSASAKRKPGGIRTAPRTSEERPHQPQRLSEGSSIPT